MVVNRIHKKGDESSDAPLIATCVVASATEKAAVSDLRKAAYSFISSGQYLKSEIYYDGQPTGSKVVASWFSEKSDEFSQSPPSSWIVSLAVYDPAVKEKVLKGKIDHFTLDLTGTNQAPFSQINVSRIEKNDSVTLIDTKGDDPMDLQQEIASLKRKCEVLIQKSGGMDATIDAQLAELHSKIQALGASENVTSLEKGEAGKQVVKGFWHGGFMVREKPATKSTVKSEGGSHRLSKLKSCGLIANWH